MKTCLRVQKTDDRNLLWGTISKRQKLKISLYFVFTFQSTKTCGIFVHGSNSGQYPKRVTIPLRTKNNNKYDLRDAFKLKLSIKTTGNTGNYWQGTLDQEINVSKHTFHRLSVFLIQPEDFISKITFVIVSPEKATYRHYFSRRRCRRPRCRPLLFVH